MKTKIPLILIAIVLVLVGLGFVFPAVAQWRNTGGMTALSVWLFLLGLAMCGVSGATMVRTFRG